MPSLKWRNPFTKSEASITNANASKPQKRIHSKKKLFFPTFDSRKSMLFWLGYVVFFSVYGTAASAVYFKSLWDAAVFFFDLFLTFGLSTLFIIGYVQWQSERLVELPREKMMKTILMIELVLVPLATIVTAIVKYLLVKAPTTLSELLLFIVINTTLSLAFTSLFIAYYALQYEKFRHHQAKFEQQLIEQNEQLKARITPHFFFNMLNTMQYLIETDKQKAISMVGDVSTLYRVSFKDVQEVAMTDEIEICQHYLSIEQYRFDSKLNVTWDLPDEDLLYDMVITSLTLQLVIEKMIVFVVEMTTATINLNIRIDWQDNWVTIEVHANIPASAKQSIAENIDRQLSFDNQIEILQQYYGQDASIRYYYDQQGIETTIGYPLKDVAY